MRDPGQLSTTISTKLASASGVIAAVILAVLANVYAHRHYQRWDWTEAELYTLSGPTISALESLEQTVTFEVLLSQTDPMERSIRKMLDKYGGHTTRIQTRYTDPDRSPAQFLALQQKYGIQAGVTQEGRVLTDAAVVVTSGERHWFISADDFMDLSEVEEGHASSKLEQALTQGLRAVLNAERTAVCFSTDHGELSIDDPSPQGAGAFRSVLEKDNFAVRSVVLTQARAAKELEGCKVLVVAAPDIPFSHSLTETLIARTRQGLNTLLFLSPMRDPNGSGTISTGLDPLLQVFGIVAHNDLVFETKEDVVASMGQGDVFFPEIKQHAITDAMIGPSRLMSEMRVLTVASRSFEATTGSTQASTLLASSDRAFASTTLGDWLQTGKRVEKGSGDRGGPHAVAMASELALEGGVARLVAVGSAEMAMGLNWRDQGRRGNGVFVQNAISWLSSRTPIVDVPAKTVPAATLHFTEARVAEVARYVLFFMPGASLLLGIAMFLRRRDRPLRKRAVQDVESNKARH